MLLDFIEQYWKLLLLLVNIGGFLLIWQVLRRRQSEEPGLSFDDPQDEFDAKVEQLFATPIHRWILSEDRLSIRLPILDGYDLVFHVVEHQGRLIPHGPHLCQIGPTVICRRHLSPHTWEAVMERMRVICQEKYRSDDKRDMYEVLSKL